MARPFVIAVAVAATLASFARAADELPDDQMAPFQFSGVINADNVYARSYSSETDYPVVKLSNGDPVVVVGNRFEWLKILPPAGAFGLVGKAWVEVRGDGSVGRVTANAGNANVRIGSTVVGPPYGKIVTFVKPGQDVKIVGQDDNFFKIVPPPGTFLYVHRRFVNLVKKVEVVTENGQQVVKNGGGSVVDPTARPNGNTAAANAGDPGNGTTSGGTDSGPQLVKIPSIPSPKADTPANDTPPDNNSGANATPATKPADTATASNNPPDSGTVAGHASPAATRPAAAGSFDELEAKFFAASKLPLAAQPLDELLAGYQNAVDAKAGPDEQQKIAEFRLSSLKLRKEAADSLAQAEEQRKQRAAAMVPLVAEAAEIQQRMAANEFKRYTAVGVLRPSTLPNNGKTLYRLTDPATGRTVVYVSADGASVASMDGQFVGVRGTVTDDAARQIKLITPQSVEAVDPAEIAKGTVSSGMTPPSLMPAAAAK